MARILNMVFGFAAICASAATAAKVGDPVKGKALFAQKCAVCHASTKDGRSSLGPNLFGAVGRPAAAVKGFNYSPAMKAVRYSWTQTTLSAYLLAPQKAVPGNRMPFAGLKDPVQLQDMIAYMGTLK